MAQDATIKLILDTQQLLQEAKNVGPKLQSALDIKGALSGVKHYQDTLHKIAEDQKMLDKKGNLKGAFNSKELEKSEAKFKELFNYAEKYQKISERLGELGIEDGKEKAGLSSLMGKIGSAVKKGGTGDAERKNYNEAKELLKQKAALEEVITTEYQKQKGAFDKLNSSVKEVNEFEEKHGKEVEAVNNRYAELLDLANKDVEASSASAEAKQEVADAQQAVTDSTKEDIAATKEDTAATEALAAAKADASTAGTSDEPKAEVDTSAQGSGSTEELAEGASVADKSIKELLGTLAEYKAQLQSLQSTGQDTAAVEQQIGDTASVIKEKIASALNFDTATASLADLTNHLNDLRQLDSILQKAHIPPEFAQQFEQIRQEIFRTKDAISDWNDKFKSISPGDAFERIKTSVGKVTSGIQKGFNTAQRVVSRAVGVMRSAVSGFVKIAKAGFNAVSKAVNKVRSHFNGMSGDMKSNFKHMITSLTKYVLGFRSLFFLVRRLRKYIGEGIQNMAQFNNAMNPVNTNITKLLSSLLYLKNAWATAFSPILTVVTPWLEALIDKIAEAGNAFSRFLGSLLGSGKVFQAVKVDAADYGKNLEKAGGSAGSAAKKQKQLNDRLAAFDDLNVLGKDKDPNNTGTGGGGGTGDEYTPDPNKMFKIISVGNEAMQKLKEMWDSADFSDLGRTISEKIVSALENIKWGDIQSTARKVGKSIATFFSGALSDKALWESVGHSMAEGVDTITQLFAGFLMNNTTDWGGGLASLVNKFFADTDWNTIRSNLILFGQQLVDNINSFLSSLNSGDMQSGAGALSSGITTMIVNAITGIHWDEVLELLSGVGGAIVDGISKGLTQSDNPFLSAIGGLITSIRDAFKQGDATVAADGLTEFFKNVFANIKIDDLIATAKEFIGRLFSNMMEGFGEDDTGIGKFFTSLQMVGETVVNIFGTIWKILSPLMDGILTITQASMNLFNALLPIIEVLLPPLNELVAQITSLISALLVPALELLTPVFALIGGILSAISPIIEMVVGFINQTLGSVDGLVPVLMELVNLILSPLQSLLGPIMKIVQIILDLIVDLLDPIMALIEPLLEILIECLQPIFDNIDIIGDIIETFFVPAFKLMADVIRITVIPIFKALVFVFETISAAMKALGEGISWIVGVFRNCLAELRKLITEMYNFVTSKIEGCINGVINGINKAVRGINKIKVTIPDWVPELGGKSLGFQLKEISTISIPRLAQGAVIPPNKEFMAVLGDQSHGTNIEAPLDTIKQAVAEVMGNGGNAEVIQLLQTLIEVVKNKNLNIGDKQIAQANARYQKQQQIINGSTF